jgi:hypothetical protein
VAEEALLAQVEAAAGLTRVWRPPDLLGGRVGVDYERVGPGQHSLTLYDNLGRRVRGWRGLRACELVVDAPAAAVAAEVRQVVLGRGDFVRMASGAASLHLCGAGLEPVNVVVRSARSRRTVVSVHRRPGEGSPCPAR